ncbi:Uncharacterized protein Rs2_37687 [Raphanus sativus]|uniref:Uncharacterized protein LOC108819207 n=1 Tax=Raphanus sativus TaxID=3726 RepID=A0A6J0KII0_RAPSA|nr:uncharacterized protein LOC108819207 [Raphanus sativus]KAJ4880632.1 Uncharacterized protein Rs2_37687 [Raphanus sativus]
MKKATSAAAKTPTVKDEWVAAAMTDDQMVVELLIRLKQAGTTTVSENLLPLQWGIRRQRRSRSSRFGGVRVTLKKDVDSARGSPKTPLSWSDGSGSGGGASASASPPSPAAAAAGDGFEDVCRQASCSASTGSGSKALPTNVITSSISERLKRKKLKSSSELKYEENLKLKERLDLQKEISSLRATLDEQKVRNQRLKRIKLDLNSGLVKNETPVNLIHNSQESKCCRVEGNKTASFFLPDLNMAPSEDEILHGTS